MTIYLYPGNCPSNVSKDAKYSVKHGGHTDWTVTLEYRVSNRIRELLTTTAHPKLVEMVNRVKRDITGQEGGAFYINEYKHVIVPTTQGALYAGTYGKQLKFAFDGGTIGPGAPGGLDVGDEWPGPHPGVLHVLAATGDDIYYERTTGRRTEKVCLSDFCGAASAAKLARRLGKIKGQGGGRIYINEMCEFFAPKASATGYEFVYLGHLDDDCWFPEPELPDDAES